MGCVHKCPEELPFPHEDRKCYRCQKGKFVVLGRCEDCPEGQKWSKEEGKCVHKHHII